MSADVVAGSADGPPERHRLADFAGWMQQLREPGLPPAVISPRRFGEALNVDLQTLAAWAHVHRNTVQRAPGSAALQTYLRDALRVLCAAVDRAGGIEPALFWFRNEPLPDFDFDTPARVLAAAGPEPLLQLLRALSRPPGRQPPCGAGKAPAGLR